MSVLDVCLLESLALALRHSIDLRVRGKIDGLVLVPVGVIDKNFGSSLVGAAIKLAL